MTEKNPVDSQVFFSSSVASKFRTRLDNLNYESLLGAGLKIMYGDGVALELARLKDPYVIVMFPKTSPSMPFEVMLTALPLHEVGEIRTSLSNFTSSDAFEIVQSAVKALGAVRETAVTNGHKASDGYIFQHFNPYDLNPKTMFNGSVSHLHLHAQVYGHSLKDFPKTFTQSGKLRNYEGSNRLLKDFGVSIFFELLRHAFPDLKSEMKNDGCVALSKLDGSTQISLAEVDTFVAILNTWDKIWKEFRECFSTVDLESQIQLLPTEDRITNVEKILTKYPLSAKNQRLLLFLAKSIEKESEDVWRNVYHGPNGAIGLHFDYQHNTREWLFAPRIFRSWSRHLPLILTQNSPLEEWTTKNESGDGLINNESRAEIYAIQRRIIERLQGGNA